jgi:hypothetical protein
MSLVENNNKICNYFECNKKIKLSDYPCKCEKFYCKLHKDISIHKCSYDYKETIKKEELIKKMLCTSDKINKI